MYIYTQKEEPLELVGHTYHVLEGPTSTQDTQVYMHVVQRTFYIILSLT